MKGLFLIVFLSANLVAMALNDDSESISVISYHKLISDVPDTSIPSGQCKVYGYVFSDELPLENANVGISNADYSLKSDSSGYYEFLLSDTIISIYAFMPRFEETVVSNFNFRSQHSVRIDFFLAKNRKNLQLKKPVIYLYSEQALECQVTIKPNGPISFTYPQTDDSWSVKIDAEGNLSANDINVPYLFWEGVYPLNFNFEGDKEVGNIVQKENLVEFFEVQLTNFGLNSTEVTDFITFWVPQMQKENQFFIEFKTGTKYQKEIGELIIDHEVDSELRIFALIRPLQENENPKFIKQILQKNERNGFTVVEWGGAISDKQKSL